MQPDARKRKTTSQCRKLTCLAALLSLALWPAATWAANPTDTEITDAVTEQLMDDNAVNSHTLEVSTRDGIVTLSGTADNVMAKDRAVRLAETIRGVRAVVERITSVAPLRHDGEIRDDVESALLYNAATDSLQVNVEVNDQTVTLTGTVDSWQEKRLAGRAARSVRGVKGLNNDIEVDYAVARSDREIRAEIQQTLRWNVLVDDALIDVDVDDGQVSLEGTVGSAAEKRQARYDAWVAGVTDVQAADLQVERWARDEDLRKDKYAEKDDTSIENAVERAIQQDPRVSRINVNAHSDDGVVTLTGTVDTVAASRAAAQNARNTVGVWRVRNLLRIEGGGVSDDMIERDVEQALVRSPSVNRFELTVDVADGQAYLNGTVDTYFEKAEAEDIASLTQGVTEVQNNIVVTGDYEPLTYDPYVDQPYTYDYDWYERPQSAATETDWQILEQIEDELFWSPFVDSDEISVAVEDGIATLTGEVDTWPDRQAATENAYEGGAIAVDNDLRVDFGPDYYDRQTE